MKKLALDGKSGVSFVLCISWLRGSDDAASQNGIAVVKHDRLSGHNGPMTFSRKSSEKLKT